MKISSPKIHWLGGKSVTPACGAWAFSPGERTDLTFIPRRKITCKECKSLLKKKKNQKHYYRYMSRE